MAMFSPDGGGGISAAPVQSVSSSVPTNIFAYLGRDTNTGTPADYASYFDWRKQMKAGGYGVSSPSVSPEVPSSAAAVSEPLQEQDGNYDDQYYENIDLAERAAEIQDNYQTAADQAAMSFSERMMQKQMDFEREMANSSYQRAVEDLRKAGLNPILAYSQGGAAVPSVSAASGVSGSRVAPNYRDTGYTKYQLDYAYIKMGVQAATDIIGNLFRLIPKL